MQQKRKNKLAKNILKNLSKIAKCKFVIRVTRLNICLCPLKETRDLNVQFVIENN